MTNQLLCKYKAKSGFIYVLIAFFAFIFASNAQSIAVSGTVSDEFGPLPGISVVVKGTNTGTATDFDGNYTLEVPSDAVLQFSSVGFTTQEVPVNGQSVINVTMQEDLEQLDEVVVVGYGVQRRESVTGSVVSIKGEELNEVQSSNFVQALQGRAPGVNINTNNTRPGAAPQIRIRGVRSLSADNDPLIVLNGVPFAGGFSDINPNDIESLDILKDASATAIYGSRGANGVIIITTKTGTKGQKATFTYDTYYAIKEVFAQYPMMNAAQLTQLRADVAAHPNRGGTPIYATGNDEDIANDTNWQDLLFGSGLQTAHNIGVHGGTEKGTYNHCCPIKR